ncbi:MAG: BsuPI-related putative proteinase inhibitor [Acidimicrobiales bacterium]
MSRALLVGLAVVGLLGPGAAGCGSDGDGDKAPLGASLEMRHSEPLRSGAPVRWTLVLRNDTPNRVAIRFPSGKDGDIVLRQAGEERYRWSAGRMFTTAVRDFRVGADETRTFAMEDTLAVPAGDYELVATLATEKAVAPVRATVTG